MRNNIHHLTDCAEYAAITYDNVYAIATSRFWYLHPHEQLVLQLVLQSIPQSCTLAQIPIHLLRTAAAGSWYMLVVTLTAGMQISLSFVCCFALGWILDGGKYCPTGLPYRQPFVLICFAYNTLKLYLCYSFVTLECIPTLALDRMLPIMHTLCACGNEALH